MTHINPATPAETPHREQATHLSDKEALRQNARFSLSSAVWFIAILFALTFLEQRVISMIQKPRMDFDESIALGILSGHPQWRAFQSRLLGPLLVEGVARLTHRPFDFAYNLTAHILLLLANGLCYRLFFLLGRSRRLAWGYVAAYAGLFVAMQDSMALAIWDYVDLITMLAFAYFVFTRNNLPLLIALFVVELLNRESATFIGLWIMLEAVRVPAAGGLKRWAFSFKPLLIGGGLIAVGSFWTHWVRDRLFISQTMPPASYYVLGDQLWQVVWNTDALRHPQAAGGVLGIVVVGALVAAFMQPSTLPADKKAKIGILLGVMGISIFLFGRITETRVWFEIAPFLLFLFYFAVPRPSLPRSAPAASGLSSPIR